MSELPQRGRTIASVSAGLVVVNLLAGALGGTSLGRGMGASARFAGLVGAFLGLGFLREWVLDARRSLPRADHAIVLLILLAIAGWGLLPGVAIGLVVAIGLFVVSYSRTDVVQHASSGAVYRSNVERSLAEVETLRTLGEGVHVMRLQGFVFFGTASGLLERIRGQTAEARTRGHPPLRFLVLDFRGVAGVDSSAVLSFAKAAQLASAQGFEIVLTATSPQVRRQLEQGGVAEGSAPVAFEPSLDRGLERCEEELLSVERATGLIKAADVWALPDGRGSEGLARRIAAHLERIHALHRRGPDGDRRHRGAERRPPARPGDARAAGGRGARARGRAASMVREAPRAAADRHPRGR